VATMSRRKSRRSAADTWPVRINVLIALTPKRWASFAPGAPPEVNLSLPKCKAAVKHP